MTHDELLQRPSIHCLGCGAAAYPADHRAVFGERGEIIAHGDDCACGDCDWVWRRGYDIAPCHECGAAYEIDIYDGIAFLVGCDE